jgi:hypothetical protein
MGGLKRGTDFLTADDADFADEKQRMDLLFLSASSAVSIQSFECLKGPQ